MVAGAASLGYFLIAFFIYYRGQKAYLNDVTVQTTLFFITGVICYYFLYRKFLKK